MIQRNRGRRKSALGCDLPCTPHEGNVGARTKPSFKGFQQDEASVSPWGGDPRVGTKHFMVANTSSERMTRQPQPNRQPEGGAGDGRAAARLLTGYGVSRNVLGPINRSLLWARFRLSEHLTRKPEALYRRWGLSNRRGGCNAVFEAQLTGCSPLARLPPDAK